jgi:hypothetical protein
MDQKRLLLVYKPFGQWKAQHPFDDKIDKEQYPRRNENHPFPAALTEEIEKSHDGQKAGGKVSEHIDHSDVDQKKTGGHKSLVQILAAPESQVFAFWGLPPNNDQKNSRNQDEKNDQTGKKFGRTPDNGIRDTIKPHDDAENDQPDAELLVRVHAPNLLFRPEGEGEEDSFPPLQLPG